MKRRYDPAFIKALKETDVRIRKSFKEKIVIFAKNPYDLNLNNHKLKHGYEGKNQLLYSTTHQNQPLPLLLIPRIISS